MSKLRGQTGQTFRLETSREGRDMSGRAGEMCPSVSWRGSSAALLPPTSLSPFRWAQHSIPIRRKQKHKHSGSSAQQSQDYSESSNILIRALQPVLASVTAQAGGLRGSAVPVLIATSQQLFEALSPKSKRACHCLELGFAGITGSASVPR